MPSGRCSRRSPWPSSGPAPDRAASGERMVGEVLRSPGFRKVWLVNPAYPEVAGRPCLPDLAALDESPDLVLLGVGDGRVVAQLEAAAAAGARGAVVFGSAHGPGVRDALRRVARDAGMALCGAGCMGFWNVRGGLRALGYVEREALPVGPVSLVTHSGSVFSTLLRTRLNLGFDLAVSSGQELVTTTADYVDHVVDRTETRVLALVLETVRDGARLRHSLRRAREAGIEVVLLPVGGSPLGSALVAAHSGAVAGDTATWEALTEDVAGHLVGDLAELADTLAVLASPRRPGPGRGLATVHDSGAERSLVADLAHALGGPAAPAHRRHPGPAGGPAGRRAGAGEPAGRLGRRRGHPRALRRLPGRRGRGPGDRGDGAGGGPGAGVRRRHGVRRRRAGRGGRDRPAAGRARGPARGRRRRGRRPAPRRGRAGPRGLPQRPAGGAQPARRRPGPAPAGHRRRRRPAGPLVRAAPRRRAAGRPPRSRRCWPTTACRRPPSGRRRRPGRPRPRPARSAGRWC